MFGSLISKELVTDPYKLLEFIFEQERPAGRSFENAFYQLLDKDPDLLSKIQGFKNELPDELWGRLILRIFRIDSGRGKALLEQYPEQRAFVFRTKKAQSRQRFREDYPDWLLENPYWIETSDIAQLYQAHEKELLAFINSLDDPALQADFLAEHERVRPKKPGEQFDALTIPSSRIDQDAHKFTLLVRRYPLAAQNWALQNQDKLTLLAVRDITNISLDKEIEETYSWLQSIKLEGIPDHLFVEALKLKTRMSPEQSEEVLTEEMFLANPSLLLGILEPWWVKDRPAAEAWVEQLKSVPMQQSAFRILGDQYAMRLRDYSTATDYYKKILEEGEQLGAIFNLLPILYVEDRTLFDKLAIDVQLSPRELEQIQEQAVQAGRR